jgi:hypothetical protein
MSRRFRRFAVALASVALVSLAMAPFMHGPVARPLHAAAGDFCGAPPRGALPFQDSPGHGKLSPECPICAAFAAASHASPPTALVLPPATPNAQTVAVAPAVTPVARAPRGLVPPSHAPPSFA